MLCVTLLSVSASFGMQTGTHFSFPGIQQRSVWTMSTVFAINPARDLGPRLLTAMVGHGAPGG